MQRTALESALIPVTAYIVVACVECYRRYPDDGAARSPTRSPPEELGRAGPRLRDADRPGAPVGGAELPAGRPQGARWRPGLLDPDDDVATHRDRSSTSGSGPRRAYRFDDGTHQAWDADGVATPYRAHVDEIVAECRPLADDDDRARIARLNALRHVVPLPALVRHALRLPGHRPVPARRRSRAAAAVVQPARRRRTSRGAATCRRELPYSDVLAAFVLDDVELRVTDFGTSVTRARGLPAARRRVRALRRRRRHAARRSTTRGVDALGAAAKAAQRSCTG